MVLVVCGALVIAFLKSEKNVVCCCKLVDFKNERRNIGLWSKVIEQLMLAVKNER